MGKNPRRGSNPRWGRGWGGILSPQREIRRGWGCGGVSEDEDGEYAPRPQPALLPSLTSMVGQCKTLHAVS